MNDQDLLRFHREIVAIRSVSGGEAELCSFLAGFLEKNGISFVRHENSVYALSEGDIRRPRNGSTPLICFNSHIDTIPPSPNWTKDPFVPLTENGKVYGLGSNDAKAPVAAMVAAFLRLRERGATLGAKVLLTLVQEEEVGSKGTERLMPLLKTQGLTPDFAIIGEPTELHIAVAQKGLLILELIGKGEACHAAHRKKLGAPNAIRNLARSLIHLDQLLSEDLFGPPHPLLGEVTLEPTMISGGTARNVNPATASCFLDVRVNPCVDLSDRIERLKSTLSGICDVHIFSDRLKPYEISSEHYLVEAALAAAREGSSDAKAFGSRGLSDLVFFQGIPAIKAGPGVSERSHTADEYVLESEILAGARFYEKTVLNLSKGAKR